jgi:predicted nucleotidyltransferase
MTKAAMDGERGAGSAVPEALLQGLVAYFDPRKIILFGSRAQGEPGPDSDWDPLVVLDDEAPPDKVTLRAGYEAARGYLLAADVIPCRRGWFERDVVNSLRWIADTQGVVVYERR